MPKKKGIEVDESEKKTAASQKEKQCGHINMHALNEKGEPSKPKCNLNKEHGGLHTDGESHWHDMAGTPVEKLQDADKE